MTRNRLVALDGLRGVAALAVLSRHVTPSLTGALLLPQSYLAVDLFFVLSGFVLAHAYEDALREGLSPLAFLRLRLVRLGPLYLLACAVSIAAGGLDHPSDVLNLAFLPAPSPRAVYPLDFPAWSLGCELVANLAYAISMRARRDLAGVFAAAGLAGLVLAVLLSGGLDGGAEWRDVGVGDARVLFSFFAGVLLHRRFGARRFRVSPVLGYVAPLLLIVAFAGPFAAAAVHDLIAVALVFPALVVLTAGAAPTGPPARLMAVLGAASYGVYVLQIPLRTVTLAAMKRWDIGPSPIVAIAFCIGVVAIAALADAAFDRPVRRWLSRRAPVRVTAPTRAEPAAS